MTLDNTKILLSLVDDNTILDNVKILLSLVDDNTQDKLLAVLLNNAANTIELYRGDDELLRELEFIEEQMAVVK